jgi:hypothetical protein
VVISSFYIGVMGNHHELLKSVSPELKAEANETRMSWISRQLQEDKNASTLGGEPLSGFWPMAIGSIHGATTSSVHCSYF